MPEQDEYPKSSSEKPASPEARRAGIRELFQKQGIALPPVELYFSFGGHEKKDQTLRIRRRIPKSSVLLLEAFGWNPGIPELYRAVQTGTISPEKASTLVSSGDREINSFAKEVFRLIVGHTNVFVHPFDLPQAQAKDLDLQNILVMWSDARTLIQQKPPPPLETAMQVYRHVEKMFAEKNKKREESAAASLPLILYQAVKARPELLKEAKIPVTVVFGAAHSSLPGRVQGLFPDVTVTGLDKPTDIEFDYRHRLLQTYLAGGEITKEMDERAFFEHISQTLFVADIKKMHDIAEDCPYVFMRAIADSITLEEWREFYRIYVTESNESAARAMLADAMRKKGIPVGFDQKKVSAFYKRHKGIS